MAGKVDHLVDHRVEDALNHVKRCRAVNCWPRSVKASRVMTKQVVRCSATVEQLRSRKKTRRLHTTKVKKPAHFRMKVSVTMHNIFISPFLSLPAVLLAVVYQAFLVHGGHLHSDVKLHQEQLCLSVLSEKKVRDIAVCQIARYHLVTASGCMHQ